MIFAAAGTFALHRATRGVDAAGVTFMQGGSKFVFNLTGGLDPRLAGYIVAIRAILAGINAGKNQGSGGGVCKVLNVGHIRLPF